MATYNSNIQITRGDISNTVAQPGKLFYDTATKSVYIGDLNSVWKRIGGFNTIVLKGYTDVTTVAKLNALSPLAGDGYILTTDFTDNDEYNAGDLLIYTGTEWFDVNGNLKAENSKFTFNSTRANTTWTKDGVEANDSDVANVDDALQDLHQSKADLMSNGKIPLSQIPATLVGALQRKGVVTVANLNANCTDVASTVAYISKLFNTTIDDDNNSTYDSIDSGDYIIVTGSAGETFTLDSDVYNSGDWMIYNGTDFDRLNASSAVDSVNGLLAAITVLGTTRNSNAEAVITTNTTANTITVSAPNAVLEPTTVSENVVLMAGANKTAKTSGIGVTLKSGTTKTKLTADEISLEFSSESGKILNDNSTIDCGEWI